MDNLPLNNSNKDKFVRFLKVHKVYCRFEKNRSESNKRINSRESLEGHIEACDRQSAVYLDSAFAWGMTLEGKVFWKDIDNIWSIENKSEHISISQTIN